MVKDSNAGRRIFIIFNYTLLSVIALACVLPLLHILAISFSSSWAATANIVTFWPIGFTSLAYQYVAGKQEFISSLLVSIERTCLGTAVNMALTILIAYPLSKEQQSFKTRGIYTWFFIITILFNGGLIPWYMTIKGYGLINNIWALILPSAVPVFNVIMLMNFFRQIPKEIEESAFIDGASHWTIMLRMYLPLSTPALATLVLFAMVFHWNSWFDGLILINQPDKMPLQSYLQTVVIARDTKMVSLATLKMLAKINDRTAKSAQIFLGALPILCVYPFLQKYFMKGMILGSVKG
jgi:putative aldouronate transport system permease protein